MITEKRLQELIDLLTTAVNNDYPDPLGEENADNLIALLELKTLRKAIKQQVSILDSREELITKLIDDSEGLHLSLCAYLDYCKCGIRNKCYLPVKAIEKHQVLIEKTNK